MKSEKAGVGTWNRFTGTGISRLTIMWLRGSSDKAIADALGRHRGVVRRKAQSLGLPPLNVVRAKRHKKLMETA